jgi:hypothetical protein
MPMLYLKKLSMGLVAVVCMALFPLLLSAQNGMSNENNMGNKLSATGCLQRGESGHGYYLKGEDGKVYELWGYNNLSEHVNHKVTVTGMEEKMPASQEKMREATEQKEAGGEPQMDLKVTHLKMVSESCQ